MHDRRSSRVGAARTVLALAVLVAAGAMVPASAAQGGGPVVTAQAELAAAGLRAFPAPGSVTANPGTQLTFRGVDGPIEGLEVVGSTSGPVAGRWEPHPDGDGASFVPAAPLAPGEVVTVATGAAAAGTYSFTVARPVRLGEADRRQLEALPGTTDLGVDPFPQQASASVQELSVAAAEPTAPFQTFRSRPDLRPPSIRLTASSSLAAPGVNLVTPMVPNGGRQIGPMVYDLAGDLVWFEPTADRVGNLVRIDYLGTDALAWFEGTTHFPGGFEGEWVVADQTYRQIGTISAGNGYLADVHDLTITEDDTALLVIYALVERDMTQYGGPPDAAVVDVVLQEVDLATGLVLFEWHSLDQIALEESQVPLDTPLVDYVHTNSLTLDTDGDLLMSARHLSSVVKIDRDTGEIVWRLGGERSDFTFPDDTGPGFPHDARRNPDGTISVFDNGNPRTPQQSRGVAWRLDETAGTATRVRERRHAPSFYTPIVGSYRGLPNGNELLSWGTVGEATEYRGSSTTPIWESDYVDPGQYTYRTFREDGWVGRPAEPPAAAVQRTLGQVSAWVSWNGATQVARWELLAGPGAGSLRVVGTAARDGFETLVRGSAGADDDVVVLRARDAAGAELGVSAPMAAPYTEPDAVYTTRGADLDLQVRTLDGGTWSPPAAHPGVLSDDPASTPLDDGRWLYAVKGQPDGLYLRWSGPGGLQPPGGWLNLGGTLSSAPSLAALDGGAATVVVCGTDGRVWQTVVSATGRRGGWVPLGGDCRGGGATVVSTPTGQLVVAAVGADRQVRVRAGTVAGLRGWVGVGGIATSAAPGVHVSDTRVVLVVRGSDGRAYSRDVNAVNGAPLGTWVGLGGGLAPRPALAAVRSGAQIRVLVLGTNGAYYEQVRTGYALGGWRRI